MGNTQRATTPRPATPTIATALSAAALSPPELVVTVSTSQGSASGASTSDSSASHSNKGSWASPPPLHSPPGLLRPTSAPPGASPRKLKPHLRPSASAATSTREQHTRSPSSSRVSGSTASGVLVSPFDSPPLHPRSTPTPIPQQQQQVAMALCANCQRMAIPVLCMPNPALVSPSAIVSPASITTATLPANSIGIATSARSERSQSRSRNGGGGGGLHRSRSASGNSSPVIAAGDSRSFCSKDCRQSFFLRHGIDDEVCGDDPFHAAALAAAKARSAQPAPLPDSYVENRKEQIRRRAHSGSSNNLSFVGGAAGHTTWGHDSPRSTNSAHSIVTTPRLAPTAGSHPSHASHTTTTGAAGACDDPSCQASHHDVLCSPCSHLHLSSLCVEELWEEELDPTSPSAVMAIPRAKPLDKLKPFAMPLLELPMPAAQQTTQQRQSPQQTQPQQTQPQQQQQPHPPSSPTSKSSQHVRVEA